MSVLAIDGVAVEKREDISRELSRGGAQKHLRLKRNGQEIESLLDYTGDPGEAERSEHAARRAAWEAGRKAASSKPEAKADGKPATTPGEQPRQKQKP